MTREIGEHRVKHLKRYGNGFIYASNAEVLLEGGFNAAVEKTNKAVQRWINHGEQGRKQHAIVLSTDRISRNALFAFFLQ